MPTFKPGELADIVLDRVGRPCKIECEVLTGPCRDTYNAVFYCCHVPGHPNITASGIDYWKVAAIDHRKRKPPREKLSDWDTIEADTQWGDKDGYRPRLPSLKEIADHKEKVREKVE